MEDTVEPSLPAREINLKACAPEIRTRNLPADPGIEPRPSGRPFRQVRTEPQPTEPPRQAQIRLVPQTILHDRSYGASVCVCALATTVQLHVKWSCEHISTTNGTKVDVFAEQ